MENYVGVPYSSYYGTFPEYVELSDMDYIYVSDVVFNKIENYKNFINSQKNTEATFKGIVVNDCKFAENGDENR